MTMLHLLAVMVVCVMQVEYVFPAGSGKVATPLSYADAVAEWETHDCVFPSASLYKQAVLAPSGSGLPPPVVLPLLEPCRFVDADDTDAGYNKFRQSLCQNVINLSVSVCTTATASNEAFVKSKMTPEALREAAVYDQERTVCTYARSLPTDYDRFMSFMRNSTCEQHCLRNDTESLKNICELLVSALCQYTGWSRCLPRKETQGPGDDPASPDSSTSKQSGPITPKPVNSTTSKMADETSPKPGDPTTSKQMDPSTSKPVVTTASKPGDKPTPPPPKDIPSSSPSESKTTTLPEDQVSTTTTTTLDTATSTAPGDKLVNITPKAASNGGSSPGKDDKVAGPSEGTGDNVPSSADADVVQETTTVDFFDDGENDDDDDDDDFNKDDGVVTNPEADDNIEGGAGKDVKTGPPGDQSAGTEKEGGQKEDSSISKADTPSANDVKYDTGETDEEEGPGSSHFLAYFLTAVVICISGYVIYHNKQKIMAFIIEGRNNGRGGRQRSKDVKYSQLKSNVEEVMPSLEKTATAKNFVY